jgi:polyhydroxyalkanoate synthesis repressor PhaR
VTTPNTPPETPSDKSASTDASAANAQSSAVSTRIIKRYSNRKLYDTVESRYVTLPQIAQLVRKGEDVRIIDNNSKEDLTSVTLAQILYEEERKQSRALPLGALKDLIHTSGEKIMSTLREGPMGKFIGGRERTSDAPDGVAAPAPTEVVPEAVVPPTAAGASAASKDAANSSRIQGMLEQSRGAFEEWQHKVDERVRKMLENLSPSTQIDKLQSEVRKLTQRLEELEARLVGRSGKSEDKNKE